MAYSTRSRRHRRPRLGRKRRFSRRPRRQRYRRRAGVSRKRILNVSTRKLKDTMPCVAINSSGGAQLPGVPYSLTGDQDWAFAFCPNARDSHLNSTTAFPIGQRGMYQRTLSDVFIRGYKEMVTLATNSGAPWLWRRLVVTMKVPLWSQFPSLTVQRQVPLDGGRSSGQTRTLYNFGSVNGTETDLAKKVYAILFEGTLDVDWHNVFNAKPDKRFVRVISDRQTNIQNTNDYGMLRNYKRWYPLNGTMHYAEKEEGDKIKDDMDVAVNENAESKFSADGIKGVGDMWVFDFFSCPSRDPTDVMKLQPNGTAYWHER